ncbi:glycosyltransferase family 39 protein [Patescibacteria group bacterium]|nr:glycosyltransferase family 39 protein [Patescibacteria group bacterium]
MANYTHDVTRELILTYKMYIYQEWIWRGPVFSVIWGFLSPVYYYLLFPLFFILNWHPLAPQFVTAILNLFCLGFVFKISHEFFGKKAAIFSTIIFSLSFQVVYEAVFGLNTNWVQVFALPFLYSLIKILQGKSNWAILLMFSFSMIIGIHASGFFMIPPFIILLFAYKPKILKKEFFKGLITFLIFGFLPYLIVEIKFRFWNIRKFFEYLVVKSTPTENNEYSLINHFFLSFYKSIQNLSLVFFKESDGIYLIIPFLIILYSFYLTIITLKKKNKDSFGLLATITFLYVLFFSLMVKFDDVDFYEWFYHPIFIPFIIIFTGVIFSKIYNFKLGKIAIVFFFILFFISNTRAYLDFKPNIDTFAGVKQVALFLDSDSKNSDFDLYGVDGEEYYYLLWYMENDPIRKDYYYTRFKWKNPKSATYAYLIDFPPFNERFFEINDIKAVRGFKNVEKVYSNNIAIIYKIF